MNTWVRPFFDVEVTSKLHGMHHQETSLGVVVVVVVVAVVWLVVVVVSDSMVRSSSSRVSSGSTSSGSRRGSSSGGWPKPLARVNPRLVPAVLALPKWPAGC